MSHPGFGDMPQAHYVPGFAEAAASVGEVRRFGSCGPAYEVLAVRADGDVDIEVIESGERLIYSRSDYLADPVATTVP